MVGYTDALHKVFEQDMGHCEIYEKIPNPPIEIVALCNVCSNSGLNQAVANPTGCPFYQNMKQPEPRYRDRLLHAIARLAEYLPK